MLTREDLANLIFSDVTETLEDLEKRYPERNLKEGAKVTRFAPSPTGFLHTGSLFTALVASKIAKDTEGIFYLRLEDTDTKREIEGSGEKLVDQLSKFNIIANEGYNGKDESGIYAPYKQSERKMIYRTVIKDMIIKDLAYPCFASEEELNALREKQTANKEITGYYGEYAIYRNLSIDEAYNRIKNGDPYVIRFKSRGNHLNKIKVHDEIRGDLELTQNDQDIVILKSDGLPTYHFAHACDDHFMHTNLVTRGEEWLPSLPLHIELFSALHFKTPKYAHLPVIMKMDEGKRRKLSKRKDPEASVDYFLEKGYEPKSLLVYLMTIANSNYEDFIVQSKDYDLDHFKFNLKKMSLDGALFDIEKLNFYGKEILSKMTKEEIYEKSLEYAKKYDEKLLNFINKNNDKYIDILNIEREKKNPRKDYAKYSDIYEVIKFFDNDEYKALINSSNLEFNPNIEKEIIKEFLVEYKNHIYLESDENTWYNGVKEAGSKFNFATDSKAFKENPSAFRGNMNDCCEILRIVVSSKKVTPNLFAIMKILTKEEVINRIDYILNIL